MAFDCVKFIIIRGGSARLFSEFGIQHVNLGDVVVLAVTLRVASKLRHTGIGRTHNGTHVILLIQDHEARIVNAITGELIRELTINPEREYQPQKQRKLPNP